MPMSQFHQPVMLQDVFKYLNIQPDSWYVDCNLGGGGHTRAILQAGGKVLGIDLDPDPVQEVAEHYNLPIQFLNNHNTYVNRHPELVSEPVPNWIRESPQIPKQVRNDNGSIQVVTERLILCQSNFNQIQDLVAKYKLTDIKGILFDLGVSTHQLETPERGFSFNMDAPLDMRMGRKQSVTAADLINGLHEPELVELFEKYGEERMAKRIARKIVQARLKKLISTTNQLAQVIVATRPRGIHDRIHPATRVFQALRIAVNDEINNLKHALPQAFQVLSPSGKLVVISFHSLEDRIVKNYFKLLETNHQAKILTPKPITPTEDEIQNNPRSRSGKLRAIEKI